VTTFRLAALLCGALLLAGGAEAAPPPPGSSGWPQWRGPTGNGFAPGADPPVTWSGEENVRWKVAIPGRGLSTPIVWGDRVFVTTAVPHGEVVQAPPTHVDGEHDNLAPRRRFRFQVLALDARTGRTIWERTVADELPHEPAHETGSWASASPVTDGELLFASFGSRGIFALDRDGEPVWQVDLGDMQIRHAHGEGSSPALHGDTLVVNWDHQGDSFVVALDRRTGKERWRRGRDEITSWSSPRIIEQDGTTQVILAATKRVRSYDLASGRVLWEVGGLSRNVVATPVAADGLAFVANSYDWQAMLAIRLSARGDLTGTPAVVWTRDRDTPYVPSPALADGTLCFIKHLQSVLTCVEARTGKARFGPRRLPGVQGVFASPVIAAGRIYVAGRNGVTSVVELSEPYGTLATNRLDESFSASPAVVDHAIYLRGEAFLYRIEAPTAGR